MELVDRYLFAVGTALPKSQRDDIVAEISDELQSQLEEREGRLGRTLGESDVADVLRAYGSPRVVAGRYATMQYLIGPDLFPYYSYVLKLVISVAIGLELLGSAVRALAGGDAAIFWNGLGAVWETPVWVFGVITLVFALMQYYGGRIAPRWDPRSLPRVEAGAYVSRFTTAFEFVVNVAVLLFVTTTLSGFAFSHEPEWRPILAAVVASTSVMALTAFVAYVKPHWNRVRLAGQFLGNAASATGLALALRALDAGATIERTGFIILLVCFVVAAAVALWKLIRNA